MIAFHLLWFYIFTTTVCNSAFAGATRNIGNVFETGNDMMFFLYTRDNPVRFQEFELHDLDYLKYTSFNKNRKTKILVHGWKCSHNSAYNILVKNAYLIQYDANVIVIDWERIAKEGYRVSRAAVPSVGTVIAFLIDELHKKLGVNLDDIHLVGHSLGAHVAGIAGLLTTVGKVARVTGLDPAGPLFYYSDEMRIRNDSAKFVDIIHTDGLSAGFYYPLGHVDFYPNGGIPVQPGCGFDIATLKSHRRAYWLFAESIITPGGFLSLSCPTWTEYKRGECKSNNVADMGEHVDVSTRGYYFLRTNGETPFAMGAGSLA